MRRVVLALFMFLMVAGVSFADTVQAAPPERLLGDLKERYRLSRIEIQNQVRQGRITRQGRLLTLSADGLPAKPLRVIEMGHKFVVRDHVMDFARVDISVDGRIEPTPAPLMLNRGTRLAVLDVRLKENQVHFLTHTADPLPNQPGGAPVYGCTEFVFHFEPGVLMAGAVGPVVRVIQRWLE
jgi:hypothetical protein